ncbi:VWA domain-containing protein [Luteococcus sediminum]
MGDDDGDLDSRPTLCKVCNCKPRRPGGSIVTTARRGAALLATATLALAVAQPTTTATAPADEPRMVLLLDSSGSMKEPAQGGMTKIEAARTALSSVIADLPVDTATGLRVFGASVENAGDPGACQDSQLVVPVGTDNRAALETAAANYKPYGETPIGHGLQEAAKDLGESGKRSIVLVSDGVATCEPDPCDVAEQLAGKGVDLAIHVVGLGVDATTRKQLQCIADKGKGTYHDAKDATQLAEAVDRAQRTLLPPKMVDGKPVKGTRTIVGAPSIRVGDWIDDIGPDGSEDGVRFYRLRRTIPGSTLLATAIVHPNAEQQDAVMATLSAGETQCGVDTANGHPGGDQMMVSATAVADQRDEDCASATDLVLQVKRKGVRKGTGTPRSSSWSARSRR